MKIVIDDVDIAIPDAMVEEVFSMSWGELLEAYEQLDDTLRMGAKLFTRHILKELEKKHGKGIRPAKGEDPTIHLLALLYNFTAEFVKRYASIEVRTTGTEPATARSLAISIESEGKSWRQVVDSGHDGNGQNNLLEETAASLDEALPDEQIVRTG